MAYDTKTLRRIYDRTSGYCHICRKKLSFTNYGRSGQKGSWEVEHSVARANGGTDRLNNLYAACIGCNRDKSDCVTKTARGWNGHTRAPLSREQRKKARAANTVGGALIGGFFGLAGGPAGVLIGSLVGAGIGSNLRPE